MSRIRRKGSAATAGTSSSSSSTRKRKNELTSTKKKQQRKTGLDLAWKAGKTTDHEEDDIESEDEEEYDDEDGDRIGNKSYGSEDDIEEEETLDAKKVRLAKEYLQRIEQGDSSSSDNGSSDDEEEDDEDVDDNDNGTNRISDHDRIGIKLQRERLKTEGALERPVADKVHVGLNTVRQTLQKQRQQQQQHQLQDESLSSKDWIDNEFIHLFRGHDLTPTCVAIQSNGTKAISGSKDHSVILWDIENEKKDTTICNSWKYHQQQRRRHHHQQQQQQKDSSNQSELSSSRTQGEVLSVAISDDGRYAAVGKRDATVSIFDIRISNKNSINQNRQQRQQQQQGQQAQQNLIKTFTGHKGPVTCLAFRKQTLQLFSGSDDRCIRHYNLNEMMYLETLYGHQFGVTDIDCHRKERPISVGRDRTARAWKLAEDSHLIFRGGAKLSSAECIRMIKDDWYLTGHDDGTLAMWMTEKKRAVATIHHAHGIRNNGVANGITSIGTLGGSDLAITGSSDGYLRLWKASTGQTLQSRSLDPLDEIPLVGFVNGIAVGPDGRFCVVAVGQEPRMGRWDRIPKAKNRFGIVQLQDRDQTMAEDEIEEEAPPQEDDEENSDDGSDDDDGKEESDSS